MDIFGNSQIPSWLVAATHEDSGGLGKSLGTVIAGGLIALQPKEDGEGVKGLGQGLAEARMNQQDPTWRVKEKFLEAGLVSKWAQAATQWQALDSQALDMKAWTTKDLPAIAQFQEELKTNPEATPPVVESGKGLQVISQLEKSQLALQAMKLKQDNAKLTLENNKTSLAFDQAVSAAPVGIAAAIDELPNQGWNLDRQGKRTTPSTKALQLYNDWATDSGAAPEKAFGVPTAIKVQKSREAAQSKMEDKRQEDRKEIEGLKQTGRIDLEKMKLSRVDANGKDIGEKKFIDRHFNTVWTTLRKNAADDETAAQTALKVDRVLSGYYYRMDQRSKPADAAGTNAAAPQKVLKYDPATDSLK